MKIKCWRASRTVDVNRNWIESWGQWRFTRLIRIVNNHRERHLTCATDIHVIKRSAVDCDSKTVCSFGSFWSLILTSYFWLFSCSSLSINWINLWLVDDICKYLNKKKQEPKSGGTNAVIWGRKTPLLSCSSLLSVQVKTLSRITKE